MKPRDQCRKLEIELPRQRARQINTSALPSHDWPPDRRFPRQPAQRFIEVRLMRDDGRTVWQGSFCRDRDRRHRIEVLLTPKP
jgi:hypothetical protein